MNIYQQFANAEVKTYLLKANAYHASQEPFTGATQAKAFFKFFAADFSANTIVYSDTVLMAGSPADQWIEMTVCMTAPAPADRPIMQVGVQMNQPASNDSATLFLDQMELVEVQACP